LVIDRLSHIAGPLITYFTHPFISPIYSFFNELVNFVIPFLKQRLLVCQSQGVRIGESKIFAEKLFQGRKKERSKNESKNESESERRKIRVSLLSLGVA